MFVICSIIFVLISVVLCDICPDSCDCDKNASPRTIINCRDNSFASYSPINTIPIMNWSEPVAWEELNVNGFPIMNLTKNEFLKKGLQTLTHIAINNCEISLIDENAFNNLTNLYHLDLSNNAIKILSNNTFKPVKDVQFLILNHNKIKVIDNEIFSNLKKLQNLEITHNSLTYFGDDALINSKNLKQLHLNNNELTYLNIDCLQRLKDFNTLKLHENPWTCDCFVRKIRTFLKTRFHKELSIIKCNAPEKLKEKEKNSWKDIPEDQFNCWLNAYARDEKGLPVPQIGGKTALKCKVDSNTLPTEEIWKHNDKVIDTSKKKYNLITSKVDNNQVLSWHILEISNLAPEDKGNYQCIFKNSIIEQEDAAEIKLDLEARPFDGVYILIIVLIVFSVICIILIVVKCVIKCHILKNTTPNLPNYQENFKVEDEISIASFKV